MSHSSSQPTLITTIRYRPIFRSEDLTRAITNPTSNGYHQSWLIAQPASARITQERASMPSHAIRHTLLHPRACYPSASSSAIAVASPSSISRLHHTVHTIHARSFKRPTYLRITQSRNIGHGQHTAWRPIHGHISRRFLDTPSAKLVSKETVMPPFVGAIDQGTTSSRFIIFDTQGAPVAQHQIEFKQIYPHPGYVERGQRKLGS